MNFSGRIAIFKKNASMYRGILGAVIGDIVGSRFEWDNLKSTDFELFAEDDEFTDDTVMTAAVADWLMTGDDLARTLRCWGAKYPDAGYGAAFSKWLFGENRQPYDSCGNGSGMRVSPVGYYARSLEQALDLACRSAVVTHNHPEGIKGAQDVAAAVYMARTGCSKAAIGRYAERMFGYDLRRSCSEIRPGYGFDETCQGSCPEAVTAFLESCDYESAIRMAVSLGGDSDTIACMTGGIAAAYYGVPRPIVEKARAYLPEDLLDRIDAFDKATAAGRQ